MSESTQNPAPRNPFANTGILISGLVREVSHYQPKNQPVLRWEVKLATLHNPELRVSLLQDVDPSKFIVGQAARLQVRIHEWRGKDDPSRTGFILQQVAES